MTRRSLQVLPGDIPAAEAAHRLGLTLDQFRDMRPALDRRGFPPADPTTGLFDLDAIDAWRRSRHPHLFGLTAARAAPQDATNLIAERCRRG